MKRLTVTIASLLIAIIFTFPTLAAIIGILLIYYAKWVSFIFCLIFTWNIAKFVESKYIKHMETKDNLSKGAK